MDLTNENLRALLKQYIGMDIGEEEIQRLRPLIER